MHSRSDFDLYNRHYKDELSLTNPRNALHHGEHLQTNKVDAQCDKLTTDRTKLSDSASRWQID